MSLTYALITANVGIKIKICCFLRAILLFYAFLSNNNFKNCKKLHIDLFAIFVLSS